MSNKITYTLRLVSDAEPSSGFGTELTNGLVPRSAGGTPVLYASHIKGLMRQALLDISINIAAENNPTIIGFDSFVSKALGQKGADKDFGAQILLTDCSIVIKDGNPVKLSSITRTSVGEFGTAKDTSLRTTEAISAGTEFKGSISFVSEPSEQLELLIRYALLSIMEVGGSRNRGCGACAVMITGENRKPGQILELLLKEKLDPGKVSKTCEPVEPNGSSNKRVIAQLTLKASSPICIPELPIVGSNTIISSFMIPASAVQGLILTKINALNKNIADACFASEHFRAWPMLPYNSETTGIPVRASASHKISKLPDPDNKEEHNFCDEAIEEYDFSKTPKYAPIKSADGVLVPTSEGVKLWRSGDMARLLTAHGVVNGDDNGGLYTVESAAEKQYTGIVVMPENAFDLLEIALKQDSTVQVGKARTVRGSGILSVKKLNKMPAEFPKTSKGATSYAFIVQSPILIEDDIEGKSVNRIIEETIKNAGWGETTKPCGSLQILFGWNRHKKGLQKAEKVIAPGSVFCLKEKPENLEELIIKGLGGGREKGFGAVLPHPGIAEGRLEFKTELLKSPPCDDSGKRGWELWKDAKDFGLMPSQIAQLQAKLNRGKNVALEYLKKQRTGRPAKIWDRWKPIFDQVTQIIENVDDIECKKAKKVLKVLHDLSVYDVKPKGGRS